MKKKSSVKIVLCGIFAAFTAIFNANAVLPIAGLAAKIINSCGCKPLVALSKS